MKFLKIYLSLIISSGFVSGIFAMEQKQEVQKRKEGQPITKDELRFILNLVMQIIKSDKITETELLNVTNNLRLTNKQFNSLIQEYIEDAKAKNPEKYKNLTKAQDYKQFQLDLIEELIKSKIQDPNLKNDLATLTSVARDLKAVRWMKESPLLKDARATFANKEYGDTFRENREAEIIYSTLININEDIEKEFQKIKSTGKFKEEFSSRKKLEEFFNKVSDSNSKIENQPELKNLKQLFIEYKILLSFMLNYAEKENNIPAFYSMDALVENLKKASFYNEDYENMLLDFKVSKDLKYNHYREKEIKKYLYLYILQLAMSSSNDLKNLDTILRKYKFDLNEDINESSKVYNSNKIATPLIASLYYSIGDNPKAELNLYTLNDIENLIKLLLKYGADPKSFYAPLATTPIDLAKEILKDKESKMSYKAQYSGYGVPAEIQKLREIVKLLENPARAEGFKPVSETGGNKYQATKNYISNLWYGKDSNQEKK